MEIYSYLAGIIDGEGSICLTRHGKNEFARPRVSVASTTREMVDFLKITFGGHISTKRKKKKFYHKEAYIWAVSGNLALDLLKKVVDFLKEPRKRNRARYLLSRYKGVTVRNGKYNKFQLVRKKEFEKVFFLI